MLARPTEPHLSYPLSQSFHYDHRLHYSWQYRRFFSRPEVMKLRECTVFRIPNDLGLFRLGITLKARGSSLDRNRTKRKIREVFRKMAPRLGSFDYNVVVPGNKKLLYPYAARLGHCLQNDFSTLLQRGALSSGGTTQEVTPRG